LHIFDENSEEQFTLAQLLKLVGKLRDNDYSDMNKILLELKFIERQIKSVTQIEFIYRLQQVCKYIMNPQPSL